MVVVELLYTFGGTLSCKAIGLNSTDAPDSLSSQSANVVLSIHMTSVTSLGLKKNPPQIKTKNTK